MSSRYPLFSERETHYLRASVADAALTLGPDVANLIFADSILDDASRNDKRARALYIPDLYSLTPSAAAGPFSAFSHDTLSDWSSSSSSAAGSRESNEFVGSSKTAKRPHLKDGRESPFVIIPKTEESQDVEMFPEPSIATPSKKGIKNFIFPPRRQQQIISKENSPERGRSTTSDPRRLHPALDDPVIPIVISLPTPPLPRASSRSGASTDSNQSTPTKLRKRIPYVGSDDLSVSSNKTSTSGVLLKTRRPVHDEDSGYVSEGTGLSSFKNKIRRKGKSSTPAPSNEGPPQSETRKKSPNSLQPEESSIPISLPIAERFGRKKTPPLPKLPSFKSAQTKLPPAINISTVPDDANNINVNFKISLPNSSSLVAEPPQLQVPMAKGSPMSDKSFIMVPDLNIMKRLGLDKYVAEMTTGGTVGANNELKLQIMEMLLKNGNSNEVDRPPGLENIKFSTPSPSQAKNGIVSPSDSSINVVKFRAQDMVRKEKTPHNDIDTPTIVLSPAYTATPPPMIRGKHAPFPKAPIIRGRESPFPTKPILRPTTMTTPGIPNSTRSLSPNTAPLRFKLPSPDRYKDVDFPRSVRSSYDKDLQREEEEAPPSSVSFRRIRPRPQTGVSMEHGAGLDSPSIYSNHFDGDY